MTTLTSEGRLAALTPYEVTTLWHCCSLPNLAPTWVPVGLINRAAAILEPAETNVDGVQAMCLEPIQEAVKVFRVKEAWSGQGELWRSLARKVCIFI